MGVAPEPVSVSGDSLRTALYTCPRGVVSVLGDSVRRAEPSGDGVRFIGGMGDALS